MIEHASSPLLLFPERIIFILIALCIAILVTCLVFFFKLQSLSRDILDRKEFERTRDSLKRTAESYDTLRRKHEKLGRDYAELWQRYEALELEHRDLVGFAGSLIADDALDNDTRTSL